MDCARSTLSASRGCSIVGEVVQIATFVLVKLKNTCDRVKNAVGRATKLSALYPGVVLDAHASEQGNFLSTQSGDPTIAADIGQARLFGRDTRPATHEKLFDLLLQLHGLSVKRRSV